MTARARFAAAIAVLAAGVTLTGASGASFVDSQSEGPATFEGGRLDLSATPAGTPLNAANLRPGQSRTHTIALKNSGNVTARLTAGIRGLTDVPADAALSAVIELRIEDCGTSEACEAPATAYVGSVRDFTSAELGVAGPGTTRHVRVTLAWDAAKADPSRQGARSDATLVWTAVAGASA